jgi:hypothetical protein
MDLSGLNAGARAEESFKPCCQHFGITRLAFPDDLIRHAQAILSAFRNIAMSSTDVGLNEGSE